MLTRKTDSAMTEPNATDSTSATAPMVSDAMTCMEYRPVRSAERALIHNRSYPPPAVR
jgi:hypothetical protein